MVLQTPECQQPTLHFIFDQNEQLTSDCIVSDEAHLFRPRVVNHLTPMCNKLTYFTARNSVETTRLRPLILTQNIVWIKNNQDDLNLARWISKRRQPTLHMVFHPLVNLSHC